MSTTMKNQSPFILLFSIAFISLLFMYPLQGFSTSSSTIITHEIDIIAGNSKCFYEQIPNDRDYLVVITEFIHTDIEGITISIHEVDSSGSEVIPGAEIHPPIEINANENFNFFICYQTHIALRPDSYQLETNFVMEESEDLIYDTPPTVTIRKPESNSLYVFNRKIHSNFPCITKIIGPIDIIVEVIDELETGIDYVEFYINNNLVENITEESSSSDSLYFSLYSYRWSNICFGFYTIRVDVYDSNANMAYESITVFKIF